MSDVIIKFICWIVFTFIIIILENYFSIKLNSLTISVGSLIILFIIKPILKIILDWWMRNENY